MAEPSIIAGHVEAPAAHIGCTTCHESIPIDAFEYWSLKDDLVCAHCPGCERRITLGTRAWRCWSRRTVIDGT